MQETEGPPHARRMLEAMGIDPSDTQRVCFLIAHHHTYTDVQGMDYRILLEADFLVNLFENESGDGAKRAAYASIFRTEAGKRIFREMFAL